jgi:hypothetical protein
MSKKRFHSKSVKEQNSQIFEDNWELAGEELLFPKDKLNYTEQEKIRLKKLLIRSPPPLDYRRTVRKNFKTSNLY